MHPHGCCAGLFPSRRHSRSLRLRWGGAHMATSYEDNFGFWEIDCPEERAVFEHVKSQSVCVICQRCDRLVRLMSTKTICAPCASALECGAPTVMNKYGNAGPKTASGP